MDKTPIKSIRARCKGCAENLAEIRRCACDDCQLYEYRLGHRPKVKVLTPRKAIAAYCLWCMGWRGGTDKRRCIRLARECHISECPLYHLRPGQKGARAGQKPKISTVNKKQKDGDIQ